MSAAGDVTGMCHANSACTVRCSVLVAQFGCCSWQELQAFIAAGYLPAKLLNQSFLPDTCWLDIATFWTTSTGCKVLSDAVSATNLMNVIR